MDTWHVYFQTIGGVAATLLGLLFVAVSLNADIILGGAQARSKHLAEQAFYSFLSVLIVSLVVLVPEITDVHLGVIILGISGLYGLRVLVRLIMTVSGWSLSENIVPILRRYVMTFVGFGILVTSGIHLMSGANDESLAASGLLVLIVSATVVSWELLVNVAADRSSRRVSHDRY